MSIIKNETIFYFYFNQGHYYVIADCGQPNASSRCPDCKSPIGAASYHQLAAGNSLGHDIAANAAPPMHMDIDFLQEVPVDQPQRPRMQQSFRFEGYRGKTGGGPTRRGTTTKGRH